MNQVLYYLIILPISRLPHWILYRLSDFMYLVLYKLVGYRKKVVFSNLERSFPDKNPAEIKQIANGFYSHFCDLVVEGIKNFTISQEMAVKRCKLVRSEFMQDLFDQGRPVFSVGGHYNNWELMAIGLDVQIAHRAVGIYTPLTNPYFEKKVQDSRSKYGMVLLPKTQVKEFLNEPPHPMFNMIFATDQYTHSPKAYWTTFLHQETAVAPGAAFFAKKYDVPVVYGHIRKVKRGYYEMEFELITDDPRSTPEGWILEQATRILEKDILAEPKYWLWTHRRWKKTKAEREAELAQKNETSAS